MIRTAFIVIGALLSPAILLGYWKLLTIFISYLGFSGPEHIAGFFSTLVFLLGVPVVTMLLD